MKILKAQTAKIIQTECWKKEVYLHLPEDASSVQLDNNELVTEYELLPETSEKPKRRWSDEERRLVISTLMYCIKVFKSPEPTSCKELIDSNPIFKGGSPAQMNALRDNMNKGKVSLPLEFRYLRAKKKYPFSHLFV